MTMRDDDQLPKIYRDAMARYAGHVQIVTTAGNGVVRGLTATACCSVSDSPATVLACVNCKNDKNNIFSTSNNFAINTLAATHKPLADAFAGIGGLSAEERFSLAQWTQTGSGAPVLINALASFDCRLIEVKAVASHWILIGEVVCVRLGEQNDALLYHNRGYRTV